MSPLRNAIIFAFAGAMGASLIVLLVACAVSGLQLNEMNEAVGRLSGAIATFAAFVGAMVGLRLAGVQYEGTKQQNP